MSESPAANPTPMIMWSAFGTTHLVFLLLSTLIPPSGSAPALVLFAVPAFTAAAVSVFVPKLTPAGMPVATVFVMRWALAESASIMGFVSWFLSGTHVVQAACAAAGLVGWALAFPQGTAGWTSPRSGR